MSKVYLKACLEMSDDDLNVELEDIEADEFRSIIRKALKEQDRDTRHACAEAVLQCGTVDGAHNACMNARAI